MSSDLPYLRLNMLRMVDMVGLRARPHLSGDCRSETPFSAIDLRGIIRFLVSVSTAGLANLATKLKDRGYDQTNK